MSGPAESTTRRREGIVLFLKLVSPSSCSPEALSLSAVSFSLTTRTSLLPLFHSRLSFLFFVLSTASSRDSRFTRRSFNRSPFFHTTPRYFGNGILKRGPAPSLHRESSLGPSHRRNKSALWPLGMRVRFAFGRSLSQK